MLNSHCNAASDFSVTVAYILILLVMSQIVITSLVDLLVYSVTHSQTHCLSLAVTSLSLVIMWIKWLGIR